VQRLFQQRVVIGPAFPALLAADVRVHRAALDRSGPDQRDFDGEVVELRRLEPRQRRELGPALHLEHADRVGAAQHGVDVAAAVQRGQVVVRHPPEEAHRGVRRTIQMQVAETCPTCGGSGLKDGKPCETCGGAGQVLKPKTIEVNIPPGVRDGSTIRLAGQGGTGSNGSEPGDLYLHVRLRPHPVFMVKGDDLEVELPIAPWEAVLGAKVEAPTIDGKVELKIPPGAKSGQRLRLRNQGLNKRKGGRGDEYVRLKIVVPKDVSPEERRLYEELQRISRFEPRS